ncbi:MAG: Sjogren's syndrome/scleroderma autoantigen 1 family protein [Candidatus Bathyarchaeia archaeon]
MSDDRVSGMADLLRQGAKMLGDSCPRCGTPLFQLKSGEIVCPTCQREVKIVSRKEELSQVEAETNLTRTVSFKLTQLQTLLESEEELGRIREIAETITRLLDVQDRIRRREMARRE